MLKLFLGLTFATALVLYLNGVGKIRLVHLRERERGERERERERRKRDGEREREREREWRRSKSERIWELTRIICGMNCFFFV